MVVKHGPHRERDIELHVELIRLYAIEEEHGTVIDVRYHDKQVVDENRPRPAGQHVAAQEVGVEIYPHLAHPNRQIRIGQPKESPAEVTETSGEVRHAGRVIEAIRITAAAITG